MPTKKESEACAPDSVSVFPNHTAGDFDSCIAARLSCKVIRLIVDNQRLSDDIFQCKPIGQNGTVGRPVTAEQRRQVSGMLWMRTVIRIKMHSRIGKFICICPGAQFTVVDMHGKHPILSLIHI